MDMQKMLKEAKAMQIALNQAQQELEKIEVRGVAGQDKVEILMTAHGELKNIKIKKEVVDPNDVETLEDLILSAFRDATNKAQIISKDKLGKLAGNIGLPPLN